MDNVTLLTNDQVGLVTLISLMDFMAMRALPLICIIIFPWLLLVQWDGISAALWWSSWWTITHHWWWWNTWERERCEEGVCCMICLGVNNSNPGEEIFWEISNSGKSQISNQLKSYLLLITCPWFFSRTRTQASYIIFQRPPLPWANKLVKLW